MAKTTLFYSGVESDMHFSIASKYADNLLTSYYYLRKRPNVLEERLADKPQLRFWIDSGAHSLQKGTEDEAHWKPADWERYIGGYCDWLLQHAPSVFAAAELDIGNIVPPDTVYHWREKFFQPLEKAGLQVVYVYHDWDDLTVWTDMCRRYRYVGVTQEALRAKALGQRLMVARRYRTKVHGFALTSYKVFRDYTMFTADSTTWKGGERYGVWWLWLGNRMTVKTPKDRPQWRDMVIAQGFDYDKLCKDDPYEVSSLNMYNFRLMEEHYARRGEMDVAAYWDIRVPYPEVVAQQPLDEVAEWLGLLGIEPLDDATEREALTVISQLQNGRYDAWRSNNARNVQWLSRWMNNTPVVVEDLRTFEQALDAFNGMFVVKEKPRRRSSDEERVLPMERDTSVEDELRAAEDFDDLAALQEEAEHADFRDEGTPP